LPLLVISTAEFFSLEICRAVHVLVTRGPGHGGHGPSKTHRGDTPCTTGNAGGIGDGNTGGFWAGPAGRRVSGGGRPVSSNRSSSAGCFPSSATTTGSSTVPTET